MYFSYRENLRSSVEKYTTVKNAVSRLLVRNTTSHALLWKNRTKRNTLGTNSIAHCIVLEYVWAWFNTCGCGYFTQPSLSDGVDHPSASERGDGPAIMFRQGATRWLWMMILVLSNILTVCVVTFYMCERNREFNQLCFN